MTTMTTIRPLSAIFRRILFSVVSIAGVVLHAGAALTDFDNPGPSVSCASARQRYPWNGKVDIDVSFAGRTGAAYGIELSAHDETGGTNLPVRTVWLEGAPDAVGNPVPVPAPGAHRLVWNADADLPAGFVADRVTVSAKLLNPIWSFESIPAVDPGDEWAPATVYHDVQSVVSYGEIENHAPTVRCLTDEWNLEASLGANVVFSGSSMGLLWTSSDSRRISLWTFSDSTNRFRMVSLNYETGSVVADNPAPILNPGSDARFFSMRDRGARQFVNVCRQGYDDIIKSSAPGDVPHLFLTCRYADAEHGSAVCGYFPNGVPLSDSSATSVSSFDKGANAAVFFSGTAGTDMKEAVVTCSATGSIGLQTSSTYSCMGNPVGRYVVPLLDGNTFFTVACEDGLEFVPQHFRYAVGRFDGHGGWDFVSLSGSRGWCVDTARSKAVAMPDGERIFFGGAGRSSNGRNRMWAVATNSSNWANYPAGHPFESWARRDVTCLLPNGKFCGVDEELGLVVVNPLSGETYVASDDPAFRKGKMGCQLLPNGKVWIIPYDCEGREFAAGTNLCGKLYEVDFGFTRSFSTSSLCSPYLKVAEGDPEPSGIKVGLYPSGGKLSPGVYAQYYKDADPLYGELPIPTRTGHSFLGWSTDATAGTLVSPTDPVPASGIQLKAAWTPNTYTVKFNANGGSGTMPDQTFTYGVAKALTTNVFARTGYAFVGWATSATGAKVYDDKQSVMNLTATAGGTVDLYAVWKSDHNGVQLWEGGPYWAETNIGAENPWDYGYYFWWGDTVGYKRVNDKWVASDGSSQNFSFSIDNTPTYRKNKDTLLSEGWITAAGILAPAHDAAKVHWGGGWRMPTHAEIAALYNYGSVNFSAGTNGVNGIHIRGKGNFANASIFLPYARHGEDTSLRGGIDSGAFWASTLLDSSSLHGYVLQFGYGSQFSWGTATYDYRRYSGYSIRPVRDGN